MMINSNIFNTIVYPESLPVDWKITIQKILPTIVLHDAMEQNRKEIVHLIIRTR